MTFRWAPVLLVVACGEVLPKDLDGPPGGSEAPVIDGPPAAATLYWGELDAACNMSKVRRLPANNIAEDVIALAGPDSLADLALEPAAAHIYYTFGQSSANTMETVERVNPDGSGRQILKAYGTRPTPRGITVDETNDAVYWVTSGGCSPCPACGPCSTIEQSRRDGSANATIFTFTGTANPGVVAHDPVGRKLYFGDIQFSPQIQRVGLDGSAPEALFSSSNGVDDLELDLVNNKLYWLERGPIGQSSSIFRMNLDTTNQERLATVGGSQEITPRGLALDVAGGKMYWTESNFCGQNPPTPGRLRRANLDGTGIETVLDGLGVLIAIEVTR